MLKRLEKNKDIIFIATVLLVIYQIIQNYEWFFSFACRVLGILVPFFWAFGIAFLLNPLMVYIEKKRKFNRIVTLLFIYTFLIGVLTLLVVIVTPQLVKSITDIIKNMPDYYDIVENKISVLLDSKFFENPELNTMVKDSVDTLAKSTFDYFNDSLSDIFSRLIGLTSGFLQFIVGLIVSIYMLYDKEYFKLSSKKIVYRLFGAQKGDFIIHWGNVTNTVFQEFFIGKSLDSFIIGLLCWAGLLFLNAPYPFLLAIIVGIFNMIPYVGPFIGAIPVVFLSFFVKPITALWAAIFILILQQFDGNILGPKILGNRMGIKPISVMLAIFIGGGLFGILGMLVGVPIFKLLSIIIDQFVGSKGDLENCE